MPNKNKNKRGVNKTGSSKKVGKTTIYTPYKRPETTNENYAHKTIKQWKYQVNSIEINTSDGEIYVPQERLKSMEIIEDFENNIYPYFKLKFVLDSKSYYKAIRHKNDLEVILDIRRSYYTLANEKSRQGTRSFCRSGKLRLGPIMSENTEDLLYSRRASEDIYSYGHIVKDERDNLNKIDKELTLYLFDIDILEKTKSTNANAILCNASPADGICYLCNKANIKNVIFAQPDNLGPGSEEGPGYPILFIPPLSLLRSFQFIDTYYGLYEKGSLIYFSLDYTYIIPYDGRCKAKAEDDACEKVEIFIPKADDVTHSSALGELANGDTEGNAVIRCVGDYHTLSIRNDSIANDYINANDVQYTDTFTGEITRDYADAISKGDRSHLKLLNNPTENPFIASMYVARTEALSNVVEVTLTDVNTSWFTPNKEYQLLFEDTRYNEQYSGAFILSKVTHSFLSDGIDLTVTTECILKKKGNPEVE